MANLNLDYACVGLNPSQYIVIAYVTDVKPWEYKEYIFSVDNPNDITFPEQNASKFTFYLKYNKSVNVTCTVNLFDYDSNKQKHIYNTISKTITVTSIDDGSLFRTKPSVKLNNAETSYLPSYASFSVDIPDCGVPPFEYSWNVFSEHPFTYFAEENRLFLIAMSNGKYRVTCSVTDAGGISVSEILNRYILLRKVYKTALANQSVFDITDCYDPNSIYFDVYLNGMHMVESLDYTIDPVNKLLIFNFNCRENDSIAICNFYKNIDEDIINVYTKKVNASLDQSIFDMSDIYADNRSNIIVFRNGIKQTENLDYTLDVINKTIIFSYPCNDNDVIFVVNFAKVNAIRNDFDLKIKDFTATPGQSLYDITDLYTPDVFDVFVYRNGLLQRYNLDYVIDNKRIKFLYPCNQDDRISLIIFYQISITASANVGSSFVREKYILFNRTYKIAEANQKIFDIADCYDPNSIYFDVYHNGLHLIENLDYTIDYTNKQLIFNFNCDQGDMITICNYYKNISEDVVNIYTKKVIASQHQTVFNISDISINGLSNIMIFRNGVKQTENFDYILNTNTKAITFNYSCEANEIIYVVNFAKADVTKNNFDFKTRDIVTNADEYMFDITDLYTADAFDILVYRNGLLQRYNLDYVIDNKHIKFLYPCNQEDRISIVILYQVDKIIIYGDDTYEICKKYLLFRREYKIAEDNQKIFDISDCYDPNSIFFEVYLNGMYMIESLDYVIDPISQLLIFNFVCNKNDIVTIYNFYKRYNDITVLNVNTKTFVASQNQRIYDISTIYAEEISNLIVFRNGLLQVEELDYDFVFATKSIVFKYDCNQNDIITVNNFVKANIDYNWIDIKKITAVADLGQTSFDISNIYNNDIFDIRVFRNGLLEIQEAAYNIEDKQIKFIYPCDRNDVITIIVLYQSCAMLGYTLEVNGVPIEEDSAAIYRRKYNVFKGKISVPYDVPDADKDALLAEINLLNSYDMRHILLFKRDKASDSNFFNAIKNLDAIYSNAQYRLCAVAFDSDNYLYFYVKCTSDYAAKTAANRLIETVSWVIYKHGYRAKDDKIAFTYEYEPALYSEQVVSDMTAYLEHVMQTKYNRMDLLEVHDALKGEVAIFLESLRNTDPIIMPGLQKI